MWTIQEYAATPEERARTMETAVGDVWGKVAAQSAQPADVGIAMDRLGPIPRRGQ